MSVYTPQIATSYGALDSNAFFDEMGVNAHILRVLARNANRLAAKSHHMFTLAWPSVQTGTAVPLQRRYQYAEALGTTWYQVIPPFKIPKKPGTEKMECRIRANISNNLRVVFQVQTIAAPFAERIDTANPNVVIVTGTDAVATYAIDNVPISTGREEVITLWARAVSAGAVPSTALYGAPVSGTIGRISREQLILPQTTTLINWGAGTSTPDDFVSIGAVIQLSTLQGELVATRRLQDLNFDTVQNSVPVTSYLGRITFEAPLSDDQVARLRMGTWEIRSIPNYALTGFSGRAEQRDI